MKIITYIFGSSLGKKYVMAVTGFFLFLFIIGHLVGNLQVFLGPEAINRYGHFLQSNLELVWPARIGLLTLVALHIWSAAVLTVENRAARPQPYGQYNPVGSTYASRTMIMSGLIIASFVVYHILHYTVQVEALNFTGQNFVKFEDHESRHDIFKMIVVGFSNGWVSGFYVLSMALLCLHLSHGISSMFQSIGWKNEAYRPYVDKAAKVIAALIFAGYSSIPVAILLGYGKSVLNK
jgi:succinate dehydrogenase / fumarate reductase cytochrome b subunit